ncbi:MAG: SCP2 sterol-binding domain-containing protein [Burkholderiales bacterium]|nr:SCP2 sterol-binding domain-containing protein [Burkholderiales bacterium]
MNPDRAAAPAGRNPRATPPRCPRPLAAILSALPQFPPAFAAAVAANAWLGDTVSGEKLPGAAGRVIAIVVRDAGLRLRFRIEQRGIVACGDSSPEVEISACAADFAALAFKREDPDTLFFERRLSIEGDTELGLLLKNALAAAPPPGRPPSPVRVLRALRMQFPLRW